MFGRREEYTIEILKKNSKYKVSLHSERGGRARVFNLSTLLHLHLAEPIFAVKDVAAGVGEGVLKHVFAPFPSTRCHHLSTLHGMIHLANDSPHQIPNHFHSTPYLNLQSLNQQILLPEHPVLTSIGSKLIFFDAWPPCTLPRAR